MAKRPSVLDTLYLDGAPEARDPFAVPLGPVARRASGRKTLPKGKRDLGVKIKRGEQVNAPRIAPTDRALLAVDRVLPGSYSALRDVANFIPFVSPDDQNRYERTYDYLTGGPDAYASEEGRDLQSEDAASYAIESLFSGAGTSALGAGAKRLGRYIPQSVREGASDLAVRAKNYLTEARPLADADYVEGVFRDLPEEMGAFAVRPQGQRQIATTYREPMALPAPSPAPAPSQYSDPEASVIGDWDWLPLEQVRERLGGLSAVPPHVLDFGKFMDEQALRAAAGQMTPRDLLKAFTVTRASIQRQATDAELLRRAGLQLPEDVTGKVRPEGAFGMWLGTPEGQAYLDAAQRGQLEERAIESAVQGMSPFGKQNDLRDALTWAASNLPGREERAAELIAAGREMASSPDEWRAFTKDIRGIGPSKSGFLASLLGRGDQPTLDARQIILNTGRPTREATRYLARRGGRGGVEGVERLAARQRALDLATPVELQPYYQHLAHHSIWDKAGDEVTTHSDVVDAMRNYKRGGLAVKRKTR